MSLAIFLENMNIYKNKLQKYINTVSELSSIKQEDIDNLKEDFLEIIPSKKDLLEASQVDYNQILNIFNELTSYPPEMQIDLLKRINIKLDKIEILEQTKSNVFVKSYFFKNNIRITLEYKIGDIKYALSDIIVNNVRFKPYITKDDYLEEEFYEIFEGLRRSLRLHNITNNGDNDRVINEWYMVNNTISFAYDIAQAFAKIEKSEETLLNLDIFELDLCRSIIEFINKVENRVIQDTELYIKYKELYSKADIELEEKYIIESVLYAYDETYDYKENFQNEDYVLSEYADKRVLREVIEALKDIEIDKNYYSISIDASEALKEHFIKLLENEKDSFTLVKEILNKITKLNTLNRLKGSSERINSITFKSIISDLEVEISERKINFRKFHRDTLDKVVIISDREYDFDLNITDRRFIVSTNILYKIKDTVTLIPEKDSILNKELEYEAGMGGYSCIQVLKNINQSFNLKVETDKNININLIFNGFYKIEMISGVMLKLKLEELKLWYLATFIDGFFEDKDAKEKWKMVFECRNRIGDLRIEEIFLNNITEKLTTLKTLNLEIGLSLITIIITIDKIQKIIEKEIETGQITKEVFLEFLNCD